MLEEAAAQNEGGDGGDGNDEEGESRLSAERKTRGSLRGFRL